MFGSLSTKIAHSTITPALGNQDLRFLQESINKEKELVTSAQKFSKDIGIAADALKAWAAGEGEDLLDVANGSMILINHVAAALNTFADHELTIRSNLKEIRTKEEQLDELRRRRKAVGSKLEAQERRLSKMGSENKGLPTATEQLSSLQNELRQLDTSILVEMARLSDHKRRLTRSSLVLKFGGLVELGEKLTIVGELGKLIAAEVPQDITPPGHGRAPYPGREAVAELTAEAARCVAEVTFNGQPDTEFASRPPPQNRFQSAGNMGYSGGDPAASDPILGPPGEYAGPGGPRFKEQSASTLGQFTPQPSYTSSNIGGTMPNREYSTGPAPVDEFGRPIDGLPISVSTMPARSGINNPPPIQQMPLSTIQHSMRAPHSPSNSDAFVPSHASTNSGGRSGFAPSGSHTGRPIFHAPPPPPESHPSEQNPQGSHMTSQGPSSRFNQQGRTGAAVERGLTLSLPLRSDSPAVAQPVKQEREQDSPFVPPPTNAPSAFKPPQPVTRQDSSDVVLGSGEADLQRTTTLPPKLGFGGDFPEWSLGFEELGLGEGLEKKEPPSPEEEKEAVESKDLPKPPPEEPVESTLDRSPITAVPRSLRGHDTTSQPSTPITQTPTTYSNAQTPVSYTPTSASAEGPRIIHDHVVDNPNTRVSGNSGRFAMFPDKRKAPSTELGESLLAPNPKFSSHPSVNRTPSPYLEGVFPVPTPAEEKQYEILPINTGATITPELEDRAVVSPGTGGVPSRSILVDPQHSRTDAMGSLGVGHGANPGAGSVDSTMPRLRFAPRPPSPITPSPVTPGNLAWASMDSLDRGGPPGGSGGQPQPQPSPSTQGYMEGGYVHSQQAPAASKSDNRLSVITPLEVHKNKETGSHPATPNQGVVSKGDMTDEQFNAMLDSFSAQVGSPNSSSNPPSGFVSGNESSFSSAPNASSRSNEDSSFNSNQGPSRVKNFLASSGGYDSSRGSSGGMQDSSLDSTAAVAGSPFPSPVPPSQAPARSFQLADVPPRGPRVADADGNFAGVGSAYAAHRRVGSGSGGSDYSDSSPVKAISAGAFRRPVDKVGAGVNSRSSPTVSPIPSPRQSYQNPPDGQLLPAAHSSPRQDYRSVSPPTSINSGYGGTQGSTYHTAQSTPNPIPGDRNSLPPGAAAPTRFGAPGAQPAYQQRNQQNPQWTGGNGPEVYVQGRASPTHAPSGGPRIPASLLPGRPGSASPLAPIGHNQPPPPPSSGYLAQPSASGGYPGSNQGYQGPPWQQQQQQQQQQQYRQQHQHQHQHQQQKQQGFRSVSPAMTESVSHEDAYGGVEMGGHPPASEQAGGQWGGYPARPDASGGYGAAHYGQGSWNGR